MKGNTSAAIALVVASVISTVAVPAGRAQTAGARGATGKPAEIHACSLLTQAEVKKLSGTKNIMFDQLGAKERPEGSGSTCTYAGIYVQIDLISWPPGSPADRSKWTAVPEVGDAAYVVDKSDAGNEEVYAKVGQHTLTIQMSAPMGQPPASVRPGAVALAKALAAKLR